VERTGHRAYIQRVRRRLEFAFGIILIGLLAAVRSVHRTAAAARGEPDQHYYFGTLLARRRREVRCDARWADNRRRAPDSAGGCCADALMYCRLPTRSPTIGPSPASRDAHAALQVLFVGSGASRGREAAARQFAAALGDIGTSRWSLTERATRFCSHARPGRVWRRSQRSGGRRLAHRRP
jgi:hypothetical protein